jgi:hypothetical protein
MRVLQMKTWGLWRWVKKRGKDERKREKFWEAVMKW